MAQPKLEADLYTVGWVAPLPFERAAATAMLDETHDEPLGFERPHTDANSYTWGRIGDHNVVITSGPAGKYGTTPAAAMASSMLSSFPQIRVGLLVGIGAGISRPEEGYDIRLGDIAVSQPHGHSGGVIQYDLFKAKLGNQREDRAFLNSPPEVLLHALSKLQAEHDLNEPKFPKYLEEARTRHPRLAKRGYAHQGFENDRLFKTTNPNEEVQREQRDSTEPEIHYGIIASGNTLFKDAAYRDEILENIGNDCICLEMEAAGLMNHFPCIVVRGISDYGDSQKNDQWQHYAAITAAAYAKELLGYVPSRDLQKTRKAIEILENISRDVSDIRSGVECLNQDNQLDKIRKWLSPPDTSTNLHKAQKSCHKGTGSWFLQGTLFKEWMSGACPYLWLHGIPGCGKTVLSSTIITHLNRQCNSSHVVLDFFFDFTDTNKQLLHKLVSSLVVQLYSKCENSRKELDKLHSSCHDGGRQPTDESLFATFQRMLGYVGRVQIVIDALDECAERTDLLLWMKNLASVGPANLHLLVTSRREEDIESGLRRWLPDSNFVSIQQDAVNNDIREYIWGRLENDDGFERWRSNVDDQGFKRRRLNPSVFDEIVDGLMEKVNGMFRWAACQLDVLQKCLDLQMLREALKSLPKTLYETYARILAGIDEQYQKRAIKILQFLAYSKRPLTIQEAVDVVAVNPSRKPPFDPDTRMPEPRDILKLCPSLVCLVERQTKGKIILPELQLAHFSVQQYLKSEKIETTFPEKSIEIGMLFQQGMNECNASVSITRICLAYLSCPDDQVSKEEIETRFSLARYSAMYWMDHAKSAESDEDTQERILNFFLQQKQAYTVWRKLCDLDPHWNEESERNINLTIPLYHASLNGLQHTVEQLLQVKGINVNAQQFNHGTALYAASQKGHKHIVQLLLQHGADVNVHYWDDYIALPAASDSGHMAIVQLLLQHSADVNAQHTGYGTALQAASYSGHMEIVQLLLQHSADVNAGVNADFNPEIRKYGTALQAASYSGHMEIVQLLLQHGADVNPQDMIHGSPLKAASCSGHIGIVQLLLEKGAN
ncbi:hypothetical protein GX51_07506, partial [Blastomyces parvus]